jgi:hypothetical protein
MDADRRGSTRIKPPRRVPDFQSARERAAYTATGVFFASLRVPRGSFSLAPDFIRVSSCPFVVIPCFDLIGVNPCPSVVHKHSDHRMASFQSARERAAYTATDI